MHVCVCVCVLLLTVTLCVCVCGWVLLYLTRTGTLRPLFAVLCLSRRPCVCVCVWVWVWVWCVCRFGFGCVWVRAGGHHGDVPRVRPTGGPHLLLLLLCVCGWRVCGVFFACVFYGRLDPWCSGPPLQEVGDVRETSHRRQTSVVSLLVPSQVCVYTKWVNRNVTRKRQQKRQAQRQRHRGKKKG